MKAESIDVAKNQALLNLNEYIKKKNYENLLNALELDNTNSSVLFAYLNFLKINDRKQYSDELKKYKFYLDYELCSKLEIKYINHKEDVFNLIDSIQNIKPDNLQCQEIQNILKKNLAIYYPKEDKEILDQRDDKRLNNLPINELQNDVIFYLNLKIVFGRHLHTYADFQFDNIPNEKEIDYFKISIAYLKIYSEILKYYLLKNDKILVFELVNLLNLCDYNYQDAPSLSRLNYYLSDMKLDDDKIKKLSGNLFDALLATRGDELSIVKEFMKDYEKLFFEILENILQSNCIKELIKSLKKNQDNIIISINKDFINYVKKNTYFTPFFNREVFGLTITLSGTIFINNEYRPVHLSTKEINLYNFCVWIVTGIHEAIGHFLKDYFYYLSKFMISEESSSSDEGSNGSADDGLLVEEILFPKMKKLYLSDILYILDMKNWNKKLDEFKEYFSSDKRNDIIKNGFSDEDLLDISEGCINILSQFNIQKKDLSKFKTNIGIKCKKSYSQPYIDLSERICITQQNKRNKFLK